MVANYDPDPEFSSGSVPLRRRIESMDNEQWKNALKVAGVVIALTAVAVLMYWLGRYKATH